MLQELPVNDFKWVEDISEFNEHLVKSYFPKADVQYPEKLHDLHDNLPFLPERMRIKKLKSLLIIYMIKLNNLFT